MTDNFGRDIVRGRPGYDVFDPFGDRNHDVFDGGKGGDEILFLDAEGPASFGPVRVNLVTHQASGFGTDGLFRMEVVAGTIFDDTLLGNGHRNTLDGFEGDDHIEGLGGNDVLYGSVGNDFLDGGAATDECSGGETVRNCE